MDALTRRRLEDNIWKIKIQFFLLNFFVYSPILFVSFQEKGISLTGIGLILAASTIAGFLFEIPTGILADKYGRKYMLALAGLAGVITMYLWTSSIYLALLAGMVFRSLVDAARSGADTALLYDTLVELKREDEYTKHNGAKFSLGMLSFGVAGVCASLLPTENLYFYQFLVSAIAFALAMIVSISLQETRHHKHMRSPLSHLRESFAYTHKHREVYKVILYTGLLAGSLSLIIVHFQFFMRQSGVDTQYFGFFYAGMGIVSAIASYYGHRTEKRWGERRILLALPLLYTTGTVFLIIGSSIATLVIALILIEIMLGLQGALLNTYLQRHLQSSQRSTVESLSSFYQNTYKTIMFVLGGVIADIWSIDVAAAFTLSIMLFLIIPPTYFLIKEAKVKNHPG